MVKKKRNLFFVIVRVTVLFIMGLVVAGVVALSQINLEALRGNVLAVLRDATGLPVEIDGAVSWKLSLRPQIELNQVHVPNAAWTNHDDAFRAEKIDVTLDLISLFQDRPTIQDIKIYDANICIEQNDQGQYSILPDMGKQSSAPDASPAEYPFLDPGLGGVEVQNLELDILGNEYSISGFQIRYIPRDDSREYSGWIKSDSDVFPFIISFSPYNAERKVYPMKIAFATGGDALIANVALEGTSKAPIDFIIKGDIPDITAVGDVFNIHLAQMPKLSVNITGGFDWHKLTFRNSSITVRGTQIGFSGGVDWSGPRPVINANLESKSVNLMELFPELYGRRWTRPNRDLNVFHDIPLFGSEFLKFDLNLHAMVDSLLVYRDIDIRDIDLKVNLKNAHARVDAMVNFAGGDVMAGADVDIASDGHMYVRMGGMGRGIVIGTLMNQIHINDFISSLARNFNASFLLNTLLAFEKCVLRFLLLSVIEL